jgi:[acyl-carrier-protein] S-malonyltransferase
VAAGSLSFGDAVALVAERGRLMQKAVPSGEGAIAAILGLGDAEVEALCRDCAEDQVLSCANYNAPGQVVIAGARAAVERALAEAGKRGASRSVPLPVSVPVHCALMKPAEDALSERLAALDIKPTKIPVVHNFDASIRLDVEGIRDALRKQLSQPVRWVACVGAMAAQGAEQVVELGPGRVLAGLTRRINRSLQAFGVHDPASLDKALAACAT